VTLAPVCNALCYRQCGDRGCLKHCRQGLAHPGLRANKRLITSRFVWKGGMLFGHGHVVQELCGLCQGQTQRSTPYRSGTDSNPRYRFFPRGHCGPAGGHVAHADGHCPYHKVARSLSVEKQIKSNQIIWRTYKTSPHKTFPRQNVSIRNVSVTKRLRNRTSPVTKRLWNKTSL
jgi:hypothetical protein